MVTAQSPRSGRRPLQPKNASTAPIITAKPNTKPAEWARQLDNYYCNKENVPPTYNNIINYSGTPVKKEYFPIESLDASLADELTAIREKLERLRIDKEKTEEMLRERGVMLDLQMKEIVERGEAQKQLEIEVDRLYRLKEIKLAASMRISPLRSLRDKEEERKMKQDEEVLRIGREASKKAPLNDSPTHEQVVLS